MKKTTKWAKILLGSALALCFSLTLCACGEEGPYEFWQPDDQIKSIEIVNVYGAINEPLQYEVLVTIKNHESFLEKFYKISFGTYIIGDPTTAYGVCIRVQYKNGDCEYINDHAQNRFFSEMPNNRYYGRRYCDQEEFFALLTYFGYVG